MFQLPQRWPLYLAIIVALAIFQQSGIIIGWSSPILGRLNSKNSTIPITSDEGSWIASVFLLGLFITSPIPTILLQYIGLKHTILLSVLPYALSWIIIAFAKTPLHLIIARVFAGIAMSFGYATVPVYLAEITPNELRGAIGICVTVVANIGNLWIFCIGAYFELWISSLASALPLVVIIFYKWFPESPYFLVKNSRKEEAIKVLQKLTNNAKVENEIKIIENSVNSDSVKNILKELLNEVCHRRAFFICLGTTTFAQYSGQSVLTLYTHIILQKVHNIDANVMSIIKASCQILTSIGAAYIVDNVGKKPLLVISGTGCCLFMTSLGTYFYFYDNKYNVDDLWWLPLASMVLFDISYMIGLGPTSLVFLGELFHPKMKPIAIGITTAYLGLSIFIIGKLFPLMIDRLGNYIPFFIFSVINILGIIFTVLCVPETKGKSLDDVQYYMEHKTFKENTEI